MLLNFSYISKWWCKLYKNARISRNIKKSCLDIFWPKLGKSCHCACTKNPELTKLSLLSSLFSPKSAATSSVVVVLECQSDLKENYSEVLGGLGINVQKMTYAMGKGVYQIIDKKLSATNSKLQDLNLKQISNWTKSTFTCPGIVIRSIYGKSQGCKRLLHLWVGQRLTVTTMNLVII